MTTKKPAPKPMKPFKGWVMVGPLGTTIWKQVYREKRFAEVDLRDGDRIARVIVQEVKRG